MKERKNFLLFVKAGLRISSFVLPFSISCITLLSRTFDNIDIKSQSIFRFPSKNCKLPSAVFALRISNLRSICGSPEERGAKRTSQKSLFMRSQGKRSWELCNAFTGETEREDFILTGWKFENSPWL